MSGNSRQKGICEKEGRHNKLPFPVDTYLPRRRSGGLRSSKSLAQFGSVRKGNNGPFQTSVKTRIDSSMFKLRSRSQSRDSFKHNPSDGARKNPNANVSMSEHKSFSGKRMTLEAIYSTEKSFTSSSSGKRSPPILKHRIRGRKGLRPMSASC